MPWSIFDPQGWIDQMLRLGWDMLVILGVGIFLYIVISLMFGVVSELVARYPKQQPVTRERLPHDQVGHWWSRAPDWRRAVPKNLPLAKRN